MKKLIVASECRLRDITFLSVTLFSLFFLTVYKIETFPPIIGFWESYVYYYTVSSRDYSPRGETLQRIVSKIPGYKDSKLIMQVADTIAEWAKKSRYPLTRQPNVGGDSYNTLWKLSRFSFEIVGFNFLGLRIISALSITLCVLFFYLFVRNIFGVEVAQYSTLVFLTFPILFVFGRQYGPMGPSLFSLTFVSWALTVVEKRPTLIALILFGVWLSVMPYFHYFSRLVLMVIMAYFMVFKRNVEINGGSFMNRIPVVRANPQFAIIGVGVVALLALYSPLNIYYLLNGEFIFPLRVEYSTSVSEFVEAIKSNMIFLVLSLTVGPNDAQPIHLINSGQVGLMLPIVSPLFFWGVITHVKGRFWRRLEVLGDLKYVYLLLLIGTIPPLLSLTAATTSTISTFRLSYAIVPIAIFAGLGLVRVKDILERCILPGWSLIIIGAFLGACLLWSFGRNIYQFKQLDGFIEGKVAGRSISSEFSPKVKIYTDYKEYYHEPYSEQVYYLNLSKQIVRTLIDSGDVILYVDRDRYIPATTNTHYWCYDYLRPFLSFYLSQQMFSVQYLEWYSGPEATMPTPIIDFYARGGNESVRCPAPQKEKREYTIKSFHNSGERKIFLVTTREDMEVARHLFKNTEVISFTSPSL